MEEADKNNAALVDIPGEVTVVKNPAAPIVYSNITAIAISPEEATIVFLQRLYDDPTSAKEVATIVSSIPNLKRLLKIIQSQIDTYEQDFGEISEDMVSKLTPEGKKRLGVE